MKTLEAILKEHGVTEYDVRTNAAVSEYIAQSHPTPTDAEINEAAEKASDNHFDGWTSEEVGYNGDHYDAGWKDAIQWLQNYQTVAIGCTDGRTEHQTQGREPGTIQFESCVQASAHEYYDSNWKTQEPPFVPHEPVIEAYCQGYEDATFFAASQPNQAIAVIEAKIEKYKQLQEQNREDGVYFGLLNIKIDLLEETLTDIKS